MGVFFVRFAGLDEQLVLRFDRVFWFVGIGRGVTAKVAEQLVFAAPSTTTKQPCEHLVDVRLFGPEIEFERVGLFLRHVVEREDLQSARCLTQLTRSVRGLRLLISVFFADLRAEIRHLRLNLRLARCGFTLHVRRLSFRRFLGADRFVAGQVLLQVHLMGRIVVGERIWRLARDLFVGFVGRFTHLRTADGAELFHRDDLIDEVFRLLAQLTELHQHADGRIRIPVFGRSGLYDQTFAEQRGRAVGEQELESNCRADRLQLIRRHRDEHPASRNEARVPGDELLDRLVAKASSDGREV